MKSASKKASILAAALLVLNCHGVMAQQDRATITIRGFVPPAVSLSVGIVSQVAIKASGRDFALIELSGADDEASQFTIPLELRTNVAYELKLALESAEGCPRQIIASIEGARPSGELVAQGASQVNQQVGFIDSSRVGSAQILMTGPRISTRGNFTSPNNALLVNLQLRSQGSGQCHWRILLRASLNPIL